ncbi:hypothetical protein PHJA_001390000 [Phtheirospermum japonicum]|uniref:Neprosin PEP catalytic domain-containing protein n=1 Tax=Phtheirospermum japonicum TaxID=374723 RepID=A0A830C5T5_9LAMI|nr:hypothetical protein PHJA_001390000 [Phtheirospermum japonicum]
MGAAQFNEGRRGRKVEVVLLFACLWCLVSLSCAGRLSASRQKLKVEKHLKRLNKPPTKTIQSPDGDIIDCVHISHQPAFDHPFLTDHKIQTRPSYHPDGLSDEKKMSMGSKEGTKPITQPWHVNGMCPGDTIPIRRTKKEDVLRASSVKRYGKKKRKSILKPKSADPDLVNQSGHQHAIAYVEGDTYYGAKATINVWEPKIQQSNEFSLSQIWVLGGSYGGSYGEDLNSIEAGWQSDAYQATGCYNLLCSGFIQVNSAIAMGASISPVSSYRSPQYDISILIWKFGNDYVMGYWPSFLFSNLADSASMIQWGGEVVNSEPDGHHTSTQMGSGSFPEDGFGKSSYFRNIQVVDSSNNLKAPKDLGTFTEKSNCYDVQTGKNDDWGHYFYYGGPGRNPNCL